MKPRIVILSAFLTPFRSGAEACAEEVPKVLRDRFNFVIVTARLRRDLPKRDVLHPHPGPLPEGEGVPVVRIGLGLPIDKWLFPFLAPFAVRNIARHDTSSFVSAQDDTLIIHAVLETFAGLALVFCGWTVRDAKRILTCQTTNRSFLKGMIVRSPDRVTVISNVLKAQCEALGRGDVVVIQNGLHLHDIPKTAKVAGRIVFVGRLEKMKGIDTLLNAFAMLKQGAVLRIVGDGSLRSSLEAQARDLGIADRVTFVGHVPAPAVYEEFAQAQIFCGLSRSEALGNVFLEAQAAGCAIVATNVGGIPDIVKDGETGLLVAPDSPKAAADAVERLLADAGLMQKLVDAGREHARGFDWVEIAKRYEAVYGQFLR